MYFCCLIITGITDLNWNTVPFLQHVICTGLWCKVEGEAECRTKLDPPMDGTDCDPGKVSRLCCLE